MSGKWTPHFSYAAGAPLGPKHALFAVVEDTPEAKSVRFSQFLEWKAGVWSDGGTADWASVSMDCAPTPGQVVIGGPRGEIRFAGSGHARDELIVTSERDRKIGQIRAVARIGANVFAVGMSRQVFRREGNGQWTDLSKPIRPSPNEVKGFESIDGFSDSEIYAAGWDGEIWQFTNGRWSSIVTPTNLILTRIVCGGDGIAYACGQVGTLLRGRSSQWETIDHGSTDQDFWGLAWFNGSLYAATARALYRLDGNALVRIRIGPEIPSSYYHLKAAFGELWCIGPKDVLSYDGSSWTRID